MTTEKTKKKDHTQNEELEENAKEPKSKHTRFLGRWCCGRSANEQTANSKLPLYLALRAKRWEVQRMRNKTLSQQ